MKGSSNNGSREIAKEITKVIKANKDKKVKQIYGLENKLIVFIYYQLFDFMSYY